MTLKPKQQRFVEEYLIDLNATQAAIRAGYSEGSASVQAARLLTNANIQNEIVLHQQARSNRTEVTQDRVLLEIARLAFNDPRKAFDGEGNLLPIKEWPDEVAAAISSIKVTEQRLNDETVTQLKEIKFWDKGKQIELAGRHIGMFNDKLNIGGQSDNPLVTTVKLVAMHGSDDKPT